MQSEWRANLRSDCARLQSDQSSCLSLLESAEPLVKDISKSEDAKNARRQMFAVDCPLRLISV